MAVWGSVPSGRRRRRDGGLPRGCLPGAPVPPSCGPARSGRVGAGGRADGQTDLRGPSQVRRPRGSPEPRVRSGGGGRGVVGSGGSALASAAAKVSRVCCVRRQVYSRRRGWTSGLTTPSTSTTSMTRLRKKVSVSVTRRVLSHGAGFQARPPALRQHLGGVAVVGLPGRRTNGGPAPSARQLLGKQQQPPAAKLARRSSLFVNRSLRS